MSIIVLVFFEQSLLRAEIAQACQVFRQAGNAKLRPRQRHPFKCKVTALG